MLYLGNNSVPEQGRVTLPSVLSILSKEAGPSDDVACRAGQPPDLGYKSVGPRPRAVLFSNTEMLVQGGPQIWARKNDLHAEQEFRTTKWRTSKCSLGKEACKSGIRRLRLVRLHTAGDRQRAAVSGAGAGPHSTVTCRTTDGAVRRGSNSVCTVLGTLSVQQQRQAAATSVRRAQQAERYIRPKDNGLIALLAACE